MYLLQPVRNSFCIRSIKETNDLDIFDAGVKYISDFGQDDLMPHFINCGYHIFHDKEKTKEIIVGSLFLFPMILHVKS